MEWGNLFPELFPEDTVYVTIKKNLDKGFDYRIITVEGGEC